MRIELTRTGGFANLKVRASVDTQELGDEEARQVVELLERVDIADLSRRSPIRGGGADRFQYDLMIAGKGEQHRLSISEDEVPPELLTLFDRLLELSAKR